MLRFSPLKCLQRIRRLSTDVGFVFDIDGVLLHGEKPIPGAAEALRLLDRQRIPFILLTNGGGKLEAQRTTQISKLLDVDIRPQQIVQSHTPYQALADKYRKVLAIGPSTVREVAEQYGFRDVVRPADVILYNRLAAPFTGLTGQRLAREARENPDLALTPFDAVLVFTESADWGGDVQLICDLLCSERGRLNTRRDTPSHIPAVPIYFSNNDLLWSNGYPVNRFGQGAFRMLIERLYGELNAGYSLAHTTYGKPNRIAYDYAARVLGAWSGLQTAQPPATVYMVGDNPHSDIIGAYNYGWRSCLVRSGVYRDGDTLPCQPTLVVDSVLDAVTAALQHSSH
ncbi:AGR297Cp [Eremothecium gossypii ATCC 10895]|uniref:AGR297Cp n=1 Tax=Eremothecium gossypii (strain ATCC 10895 / CBS 109.51 / FGSC 9923 / NRRL Y-1056) TaxID=284811 RepID=Q74ZA6_EREGS|nr:AGR297Cp [Eremothecium gossypii ATCC 10895]AAS54787.2 AGR297Cp [Eremothecium gossypii ATCC 10895]